jgi:hypothetical protein
MTSGRRQGWVRLLSGYKASHSAEFTGAVQEIDTIHETGRGVVQDYEEAVRWYQCFHSRSGPAQLSGDVCKRTGVLQVCSRHLWLVATVKLIPTGENPPPSKPNDRATK